VEQDIQMLRDAGERFWKNLEEGREPALILPSI
jgi:hypothetical protein